RRDRGRRHHASRAGPCGDRRQGGRWRGHHGIRRQPGPASGLRPHPGGWTMTKISDLPEPGDFSGDELLPIVQDGVTKRATLDDVATAVINVGDIATDSELTSGLATKTDKA